jgi:hypothetical protein
MDPNACLASILAALAEGEFDNARDHITDLEEWTRNGGFRPRPAGLEALAESIRSGQPDATREALRAALEALEDIRDAWREPRPFADAAACIASAIRESGNAVHSARAAVNGGRYGVSTFDICVSGMERLRSQDEFILLCHPTPATTADEYETQWLSDIDACDRGEDFDFVAVRAIVRDFVESTIRPVFSRSNPFDLEDAGDDAEGVKAYLFIRDHKES